MFWLSLVSFLFIILGLPSDSMQCGYRTINVNGEIKSPHQGTAPRNSFECTWSISAPPGSKIRLEATSFNGYGSSSNCQYDYVVIQSLTGENKYRTHGTYCGSYKPPIITSERNELRIQYHYRYSGSASYFTFIHNAVPPPSAYNLTAYWITNNIDKFFSKQKEIPRAVSALFLFNESYFVEGNTTGSNLTVQLRLQLAADLVRNNTHPISPADLSHHVTSLMAVCINPRSAFGLDLVHHLRMLVDNRKGPSNPYYFLTLCNAGEKITSTDIKKLKSITESHKQDMFWLDFQAMALMTLVCVKEQNKMHYRHDVETEIVRASSELKKHQLGDGSFGSLQTTSLVVQALTAANSVGFGWNRKSAIEYIEPANDTNGSFGNMYNLYAAIPVISGKTLLYINSSRCDFTSDGLTPLDEIKNKVAEPIHVLYSVWIGDNVDYSYTVSIKVPNRTKFLDFMRLAATTDEKFQFRWKYVKDVPYIYEINGLVNDPSSGRYWAFLTGPDLTNLRPHAKGVKNYIPGDGDIAVMWYKTVSIEHYWQEIDINEDALERDENSTVISTM